MTKSQVAPNTYFCLMAAVFSISKLVVGYYLEIGICHLEFLGQMQMTINYQLQLLSIKKPRCSNH